VLFLQNNPGGQVCTFESEHWIVSLLTDAGSSGQLVRGDMSNVVTEHAALLTENRSKEKKHWHNIMHSVVAIELHDT